MSQPLRGHLAQESDRLRRKPFVVLTALTLVAIVIGIAWPWWMIEAAGIRVALHSGDGPEAASRVHRIAGILQGPVGRSLPPASSGSDEQFAVVDGKSGVVRLPTQEAMDLWLSRQRGAP